MAYVSDVVEAIAQAEGIDFGTAAVIARYAREAGHLSQGARGRNAPQATPADCANILIALNGAENSPKDAPRIVGVYRDLLLHLPYKFAISKRAPHFLREGEDSFGKALEGLIARAIDGELQDLIDAASSSGHPKSKRPSKMEIGLGVAFRKPYCTARIWIYRTDGVNEETLHDALFIPHVDRFFAADSLPGLVTDPDKYRQLEQQGINHRVRNIETTIGRPVFDAIAKVMTSKAEVA